VERKGEGSPLPCLTLTFGGSVHVLPVGNQKNNMKRKEEGGGDPDRSFPPLTVIDDLGMKGRYEGGGGGKDSPVILTLLFHPIVDTSGCA